MAFASFLRYFSNDLAIDLGTANTLVYARNKGIVVREPSIVVVNKLTNRIEAVGGEAKEMLGRTPGNIQSIRPMKDGVIADFEVTERMLEYFIKKAHDRTMYVRPRIVIGVPSEITQVEKRAVRDSATRAGATEVFLVEQAMMAAIGAGLPITEPSGNMIVDIGGGTTDVAVISLAGTVYSRSVRIAGNEMDDAIIQYLKRKYNLLIGERSAEQLKMDLGSAFPLKEEIKVEIKGRDLIEGVPRNLTITDAEIREALAEPVVTIVEAVRMALERTPPELSADIMDKGIVLSGGGSLLKRSRPAAAERNWLAGGAGRRSSLLRGAGNGAGPRRHRSAAKGLYPLSERQARWLLIVLLVGQLILLTAQIRDPEGKSSYLEAGIVRLVAPVTGFVTWVGSSVTGFSEDMALRRTLLAENLRLREEVGELREQSIRNFGLKEDLDHLARALTYTRAFEAELQVADLVYVDYASWLQTAVLRTAADTVRVNQPVVSGKGLVGRIVLVTGPYAKVQLITDRAASVGVMIERTHRQGVIKGGGRGNLEPRLCIAPGRREGRRRSDYRRYRWDLPAGHPRGDRRSSHPGRRAVL